MDTTPFRDAYPSDVSDEEWAFVAPYLTLMREDAPQRDHSLREVFNGLRWLVRAGAAWRMLRFCCKKFGHHNMLWVRRSGYYNILWFNTLPISFCNRTV